MSSKHSQKWYVAVGPDPVGPFDVAEIRTKLEQKDIVETDFVSTSTKGPWKRLADQSDLLSALQEKSEDPKLDVKKSAKKGDFPEWFLFYNQAQHGPFSKAELGDMLSQGKLNDRVHAWKDGMDGWVRIQDIPNFSKEITKSESIWTTSRSMGVGVQDARSAPRKPLVARIFAANEKVLSVGVCRDISVGGMQVLTEKIPGAVGDRVKLNISPSGTDKIEPFVAQGKIVRLHEDGRGFSFRFEKLDNSALKSIEKYIASLEE